MDAGTLTDEETEAVGRALMRLEETVREIGEHFGLAPEDLKLDLGPSGKACSATSAREYLLLGSAIGVAASARDRTGSSQAWRAAGRRGVKDRLVGVKMPVDRNWTYALLVAARVVDVGERHVERDHRLPAASAAAARTAGRTIGNSPSSVLRRGHTVGSDCACNRPARPLRCAARTAARRPRRTCGTSARRRGTRSRTPRRIDHDSPVLSARWTRGPAPDRSAATAERARRDCRRAVLAISERPSPAG